MSSGVGARGDSGRVIDAILGNPLVGLSPWIVYAIIEGENRLELSAAVAFGIALIVLMANWLRGSPPKMLEYADVVFFGALAIFIAIASDDTHNWLELWSGEVANLALVVIVLGSILIRRPFTLQYAKEDVPPELWDNPRFLRTNYVISWVWAVAFLIQAASGLYGDAVLDDSNNIWTGWVIQTLPMIFAAQFTLWYPDKVQAAVARATGDGEIAEPPIADFLGQCTPWIVVIGVIVLAMDEGPTWLGVVLIVVGASLTRSLQSKPEAGEAQAG